MWFITGCAVRSAIESSRPTSARAEPRSQRATKVGTRQLIASVQISTSPSSEAMSRASVSIARIEGSGVDPRDQ